MRKGSFRVHLPMIDIPLSHRQMTPISSTARLRFGTVTAVIAHRGASRQAPENTVEAFRRAVELGAEGIELDVRRTLDGLAVIHHDAHLTDGRLIAATRREDLPSSVPDLPTALDACSGAFVNIEIKNHRSEPDHDPGLNAVGLVVAEIERRPDPIGRWLISSFDLATIDEMRRALPTSRTAYLTAGDATAALATTSRHGHHIWHPNYRDVDAALIRRAHAIGIAVNVWTCDDPATQRQLMADGIDGICTNVPDIALAVRRAQN